MPVNTIAGRIEPTTPYISDLITAIEKGEIKVPRFQRPFVWKEEQAVRLLDSIANNYPVGSLLIWRTHDKIASERNIGDFLLPQTDDMSPTDYVLDGQQRLTVVYSTFAKSLQAGGFEVSYDLENQEFLRPRPGTSDKRWFPLRCVYDTPRLLNYRTELQTVDSMDGKLQTRLDQLLSAFNSYRFPVLTLKDLGLEQVCPIFERINSSGTKLSVYDLMVAATFSAGFDLNNHITRICQSLDPKGFGDVDRESVLKCLSAVAIGTIKESAIKSLRDKSDSELDELISATEKSLEQAIDLFSTQYRIHSWDFLAYEALLAITAYIYSHCPKPNADQVRRLNQWFWRASFSERYKVGGENFVSKDLDTVLDWVVNDAGVKEEFGFPMDSFEFRSVTFRSNYSRSRAFILMLASMNPRDLITGTAIDVSEALSGYNKKQYHHIYPKDWVRENYVYTEPNVLANVCMTSAASNNWIRARDPRVYIPQAVAALGDRAKAVFKSNLMPDPSEFDYEGSNYYEFIEARSILLGKRCNELCDV